VKRGERTELGKRYKIIYSGKNCTMNNVGVIMDEEMKSKVMDEVRKNNRVIVVKLILEEF